MSADNFFVVRKDPSSDRWALTSGFASDGTPACMLDPAWGTVWFATEEEAHREGLSRYSEYGVLRTAWCVDSHGHADDCELSRRAQLSGSQAAGD